jgi:hypothetical protein
MFAEVGRHEAGNPVRSRFRRDRPHGHAGLRSRPAQDPMSTTGQPR